jgi:hypothetical protein
MKLFRFSPSESFSAIRPLALEPALGEVFRLKPASGHRRLTTRLARHDGRARVRSFSTGIVARREKVHA